MDNTQNQIYPQPSQSSGKTAKIGLFLIGLAVGIIITAVAFLLYNFISSSQKTNAASQNQELIQILEKNISNNQLLTFKDLSNIEFYSKQIDNNNINVLFLANLSEEKIKSIYGTDAIAIQGKDKETKYIEAVSKVAIQADYIKENGEWKLSGDLKIYQTLNFDLLIESLNTVQKKAKDAAVKAALSQTRAQAEMYAYNDSNNYNGNYLNFYSSPDAKTQENFVKEQDSTIIWGANKPDSWVACAKLTSNNNYYCVDSRLTAVETATPCTKASTICPE